MFNRQNTWEQRVLALFTTKGDQLAATDMQETLNKQHLIKISLGRLYVVIAKLEEQGKLKANLAPSGRTYYSLGDKK